MRATAKRVSKMRVSLPYAKIKLVCVVQGNYVTHLNINRGFPKALPFPCDNTNFKPVYVLGKVETKGFQDGGGGNCIIYGRKSSSLLPNGSARQCLNKNVGKGSGFVDVVGIEPLWFLRTLAQRIG